MSNLSDVVHNYRERHGAELLTDTADVDTLRDHALDVLDGITAETYPTQDRSAAR